MLASTAALPPFRLETSVPSRRYRGNGGKTKGAFGGPSKRAKKDAFIARSSEAAKEIANERGLKQAYRRWRESMTPEELAAARRLKVHFPAGAGGEFCGARGGEAVDIDFHDPADLPECAFERHPMEDIEPQSEFSVAIASLGSDEITAAADCFSAALTWALDVPDQRDLVRIGRRALAMILHLRPDLMTTIIPASEGGWEDARGFELAVTGDHAATGEIFGRVLEWVRRGDRVSAIGERLCLVAYVVRPAMIDSPTLEALGEVNNKTRQAKDKLVTCLRDTFAGLKSAAQRGERTRLVCQRSH